MMYPIHPTHEDAPMEYALIPVILMWVFFVLTIYLGWWDQFIVAAVEHFPIWHWGG